MVHLYINMAENIRAAPKLQEFYSLISDNDRILTYLREQGLIDSSRTCESCSQKMIISKNGKKAEKEEWRCCNCLRVESIRKDSIFKVDEI